MYQTEPSMCPFMSSSTLSLRRTCDYSKNRTAINPALVLWLSPEKTWQLLLLVFGES